MAAFFEIACLDAAAQKRLAEELERRVAAKKKDGVFTEHDVREIEELRLRPLADIQDVQTVYEDFLFRGRR